MSKRRLQVFWHVSQSRGQQKSSLELDIYSGILAGMLELLLSELETVMLKKACNVIMKAFQHPVCWCSANLEKLWKNSHWSDICYGLMPKCTPQVHSSRSPGDNLDSICVRQCWFLPSPVWVAGKTLRNKNSTLGLIASNQHPAWLTSDFCWYCTWLERDQDTPQGFPCRFYPQDQNLTGIFNWEISTIKWHFLTDNPLTDAQFSHDRSVPDIILGQGSNMNKELNSKTHAWPKQEEQGREEHDKVMICRSRCKSHCNLNLKYNAGPLSLLGLNPEIVRCGSTFTSSTTAVQENG